MRNLQKRVQRQMQLQRMQYIRIMTARTKNSRKQHHFLFGAELPDLSNFPVPTESLPGCVPALKNEFRLRRQRARWSNLMMIFHLV
jgi:hypothetical protein